MNHYYGSEVHQVIKFNRLLDGLANKHLSIQCKVHKCKYSVLIAFSVDDQGNYTNLTLKRANSGRHTADAHVREYQLSIKNVPDGQQRIETRAATSSCPAVIITASDANAVATYAHKPSKLIARSVVVALYATIEYAFTVRTSNAKSTTVLTYTKSTIAETRYGFSKVW